MTNGSHPQPSPETEKTKSTPKKKKAKSKKSAPGWVQETLSPKKSKASGT